MTTATKEKTSVQPFGVEMDPPRNIDVIIQTIPGCRLRGSINASKTVKSKATGMSMVPKDQARALSTFPPIPGMELHVNPAKLTYMIIDPLYEDEALCEAIRMGFAASDNPYNPKKIGGVPPQKGTLDVHRMKTLCIEILNLKKEDYVKIVKGTLPDIDDVEAMPGKELLNPGSRVQNSQPIYKEDFPEWVDRLSRSGA